MSCSTEVSKTTTSSEPCSSAPVPPDPAPPSAASVSAVSPTVVVVVAAESSDVSESDDGPGADLEALAAAGSGGPIRGQLGRVEVGAAIAEDPFAGDLQHPQRVTDLVEHGGQLRSSDDVLAVDPGQQGGVLFDLLQADRR